MGKEGIQIMRGKLQEEKLSKKREIELIERIKLGDTEAYNEIINSYRKYFLGIIKLKLSNPADLSSAEDIFHDTCIEVMKKIDIYDSSKGRFSTFFLNTLNFMIKRYFDRKKKKQVQAYGIDESIWLEDNEDQALDFLFNIEQNEYRDLYNICLKVLFKNGGSPHQIIAFCFNRLIYPAKYESNRGYPMEIVKSLSDIKLKGLYNQFQKEYSIYFKKLTSDYMVPVYTKLENKEDEIVVGEKYLKNYYGKNPPANVSDWSYRVGERVKRVVFSKYYELICEENAMLI